MLSTLVTLWVIISLLGYLIHRALHHRVMGPLHRMHMQHYRGGLRVRTRLRFIERWFGGLLFTLPALVVTVVVVAVVAPFVVPSTIEMFVVMMLTYGISHDMLHAAFHRNAAGSSRDIRQLHMAHHADHNVNFGMLVFFWDRIFGTFWPLELCSRR